MGKWSPAILMVLVGIALGILGTTPPSSKPADAPDTAFSAQRAMEHVTIIAAQPHPTGSAANAEVRQYLQAELEKMGAAVETAEGFVPEKSLTRFGKWSGTRPDALTLTNVIGILPGRDRAKPAIALMAHHDTVWGSPGAPDDTAGVASILEAVWALSAQGQPERDIIVLLTDGEELGLLGAQQFVAENPLADRIGAIINLEARGGGGRTTLFQTSANNGEAVEIYARATSRPGGSSLATFIYGILPNDTDLTPALERDYVAYNLSFIGRPGLYHSPKATPERLDRGSIQDMGDQTLELTAALANADALPGASQDKTFFDVFGLFVIHYGTMAGWFLLATTAIVHVLCLRTNPAGSWRKGVGASLGVIAGGGAVLLLINIVSGAGAGENLYYDRLAAIPLLEVQAFLVAIAALAITAPLWAGRTGTIIGLIIAAAMQFVAPTTSFLVVWPLLLGGLAGLSAVHLQGTLGSIIRVVLGGAVIGMLLQFGHQFMQGVGPDFPSVVALLAALALPVLGATIPRVNRKAMQWLAGLCLIGATITALYVRFDPVADTVPVYDSMKG